MTEPTSTTIPLDTRTQRFFQGVGSGSAVRDLCDPVHDLSGDDHNVRLAMYWFYVGAKAVGEHEVDFTDDEQVTAYLQGASTRAPQEREPEDRHIRIQYGKHVITDPISERDDRNLDEIEHDVRHSIEVEVIDPDEE